MFGLLVDKPKIKGIYAAVLFYLDVVRGLEAPRTIKIDAPNFNQVTAMGEELGYTVLEVRRVSAALTLGGAALNAGHFDVPVFVEQLRDLLQAGLSVVEALNAQRRGASSGASVIDALERNLKEGKTLSAGFAADARFPQFLVALVRAAEQTSNLVQALTRYLEHQARASEVRHRLIAAAIYPLLLIGVGSLVLLFLFFYVMPQFARVFEGMDDGQNQLPWSARAMVAWSKHLHTYGVWWLFFGAGLLIVLAIFATSPRLREGFLRKVLASSVLGNRLKIYFLANWFRAVGMLVQGGIPLPEALGFANELLPLALRTSGRKVVEGIQEGLSPSAAHVRAGMSTPVAEQLMLAGERTGDLGTVLTRIAHYHEVEINRSLERTMRAVEPIVMILIGVGVGVVVVLMYMPIFELASAIQ